MFLYSNLLIFFRFFYVKEVVDHLLKQMENELPTEEFKRWLLARQIQFHHRAIL